MKKSITTLLMLTFFMIVTTGCFSEPVEIDPVKDELLAAIQALQHKDYQYEGSVSLDQGALSEQEGLHPWAVALLQHAWHWNGIKANQNFEISMDDQPAMDQPEVRLKGVDQQWFVHLRELNESQEYIAFPPAQTADQKFVLHEMFYKLIENRDAHSITRHEEVDSSAVQITVPLYAADIPLIKEQLTDSASQSPAPMKWAFNHLRLLGWIEQLQPPETEDGNENPVEIGEFLFELSADNQLDRWQLNMNGEQLQLELSQGYTYNVKEAEIEVPEAILPWQDIQTVLAGMVEEQNHPIPDTLELDAGVDWQTEYSYADGSSYSKMAAIAEKLLQAIADKDQAAFAASFRNPDRAEQYQDYIQTDRSYRFVKMEDLRFKSPSGSVSIGVLFDYVDPGDQQVSQSGMTLILKTDENGEWKIDSIR